MAFNITCAGTAGVNTGLGTCSPKWNDTVGILLLRRGVEIDNSLLTATAWTGLGAKIIDGTVLPLPRVSFEAKATVETQSKEIAGRIQYIKEGERRATYRLLDVFGCVQNNLRGLNNGKWTAILIDSVGSFLGREGTTAAKIKGFTLSELFFTSPDPTGVAYGENDEQMVKFAIDPTEFEAIMAYGSTGFPFADIQGITSAVIAKTSFTTSAITVTVAESCNDSAPVTGGLPANFTVSQGGVAVVPSGVVESTITPGTYAIAGTFTENPAIVSFVPTTTVMNKGTATIAFV